MMGGGIGLKSPLPLWIGIGTVVVTTALLTLFFYRRRNRSPRTLLDPNTKYSLKLIERTSVSHNTIRLRFALPSKDHILGLPPGQHIYLSAQINGSLVVRTYSPVSSDNDHGFMEIIVKVYFKNENPKYPDGGKMSQYLNDLELGAMLDIRGPAGKMVYYGNGEFVIRGESKKVLPRTLNVKQINMIAGGSGITPMLQILTAIFKNPGNAKRLPVSLIFANQTEDDILCREELEDLAAANPNYFKLWYTLSQPPKEGWTYSAGRVNGDMFKDHLHPASPDTITLMCGPTPMVNSTCIPELEKLGYDSSMSFVY